MRKIYFLNPDVRFDDKLVYTEEMRMDTKLCPRNAGFPSQHAMYQRWVRPIRVIGPVQRMTDFEWSVYRDILLEEDIVKPLMSSGFSGIEFRPAELYTTTETPIGMGIFQLRVTGWGGIAPPQSGIRVMEECPQCGRKVFSGFTNPVRLFSVDAWDGSDFFIIWPMPKFVFVTKDVADWITRPEFSGVCVKPLADFPKPIAGGYSPGHLHDWFDDKRVTEIMSSLQKGAV